MISKTIFTNIKELIGVKQEFKNIKSIQLLKKLNVINNAFLVIEDDKILDFGEMNKLNLDNQKFDEIIDLKNKSILPTWNDSHTHLVFAGTREQEFVDRINGLSYQEIAKKGGGILNSAEKLANTSFDQLYESSAYRLEKVMKMGTGAIEIKSGYGLSLKNEIKILKVIALLKLERALRRL